MTAPISVSALNEQIKNLLESTFVRVYVEGELSRITYHNSGHVYFTLKDAGSAISCVMFRGNASKLRFRLEEGLKVLIDGAITLYKPRGQYQLNAFMIEPSGHGALALAYEQLKQKLSVQGYFEPTAKKAMPSLPKRIALVTSATGAALQDMQRVASHRWPMSELFVYDAVVQGEGSASSIVSAIKRADTGHYDVIVIGRGGGSIEDLWGFNEEIVADAVFHAKTPIVSAVGHEIDWVITDFVADLRAPTPSAAMQMILPDQHEMLQYIDGQMQQFEGIVIQRLHRYREQLQHLQESYSRHSIEQRLKNGKDQIEQLMTRLSQNMEFKLQGLHRELAPLHDSLQRSMSSSMQAKIQQLNTLYGHYAVNDPKRKSKKGFAQIAKDGKVIELGRLKKGDRFDAMDDQLKVTALVETIEPISK